jgi:hypothetical protein
LWWRGVRSERGSVEGESESVGAFNFFCFSKECNA